MLGSGAPLVAGSPTAQGWSMHDEMAQTAAAREPASRQRLETEPDVSPDWVDITRALASLPPNHRRAVVLHHLGGVSVAEIAADSDVAENTVKSWLFRGRAALAGLLDVPGEVTSAHE